MNILVVCPTLNQGHSRLRPCLESFARASRKPERIVIIDNGQQDLGPVFADWTGIPLTLIEGKTRLSLAESFNIGLNLASTLDSYMCWSNDDLIVDHYLLERLERAALDHPACEFLYPDHGAGCKFSLCFMDPKRMLDLVGEMDTQFTPAFFEDNDYARRMMLAGIKQLMVAEGMYIHEHSATTKAYDEEEIELHHQQFRENQQRYIDKWGGLPEQEWWFIPYNGFRGE